MTITIPYYVVRERHGSRRGYWCPTPKMKLAGFSLISCGVDGPEAWATAATWNERWQQHRRGKPITPAERRKLGYVYFLKVGDRMKIGFSTNIHLRVRTLAGSDATRPNMMMAVEGTMREEARLHRLLAAYRLGGEWFKASPTVMRVAMRSLMLGRPAYPDEDAEEEQTAPESLTAGP